MSSHPSGNLSRHLSAALFINGQISTARKFCKKKALQRDSKWSRTAEVEKNGTKNSPLGFDGYLVRLRSRSWRSSFVDITFKMQSKQN